MADRRQSFSFRFWPTRRTSSLPPTTTDSPPPVGPTTQPRQVSRQTTTSTTTPKAPQAPPARSRPISRQTPTTTTTTTTTTPPLPPSIGGTQTQSRPPSPSATNSTSVVQSKPDPKSPTVETLADGHQSNATAITNPTSTNPTSATQTPPQSQSTTNHVPNSTSTIETPTEDHRSIAATGTTNPTSTNPTIATQTSSQPMATTSIFPVSKPTPEPQADQLPPSTDATRSTFPPPITKEPNDDTPKSTTSPPPSPSFSNTTPLEQKTPLLNEMQATSPPDVTPKISPQSEPTSSPLSTPTKPVSLSKSGSPARLTNQFKPPPQPLSPSRSTPHTPPITSSSPSRNSKTPSTTQASQPRSLSRSTSNKTPMNSPKRPPNSPSKEPKLIGPIEKGSSLEAPQQESELKTEAKSNSANNELHGVEEITSTVVEHGNASITTKNELVPTGNLKASIINNEDGLLAELNAANKETKYMKEVMPEMQEGENEQTKKEADGIVNPASSLKGPIIEKCETPSEKKEMLFERKGISPTSFSSGNPTSQTSQPNKRSTILGTHDKSAQTNGENVSLNKDIKGDISAFLNKTAYGDPKNGINNKNVNIITLAGENRGASMQMGPTSLKDGPVHIRRAYKVNPDESADTVNDREESSKGKELEDAKATEAFVNNNTQGINNSVVFNVSIAERNPGVHLAVTHVPKDSIWPAGKISLAETKKAEYNTSRAEKITYEPMVRRRCLRGLFMETSGSDLENPEKPRRHGCRVGCQQEKENNADIS